MFKLILLIVVAALVIVLIYAATRPDTFRVARSISINAAPDVIFHYINDFQHWGLWSPYEKRDPAMKRTFSGSQAGVGAVYAWEGDKNVGAGRMEILAVTPPNKILIQLNFFKPFANQTQAEFTIIANGNSSEVTWAMSGPSPYFSKLMGLFFSMNNMIGKDFAAGLENLKQQAEKQ